MAERTPSDALTSLTCQLGLPLIEESERGDITLNSAARALMSGTAPSDFATAISRAAGSAQVPDSLLRAIQVARESGSGTYVVADADGTDRFDVAMHAADGRVSAILLPRENALTLAAQRRATAHDATAGALHEVANALTAIVGWSELHGDTHTLRDRLEWIRLSAESAWEAARDVLQGAKESTVRAPIDVAEVARNVSRLVEPIRRRRSVQLDTQVDEGAWVESTRSQLFSIVWNLTKNAIEAVSDHGHVTVRVGIVDGTVIVDVIDDGPGLSASEHERAFLPYFTTKAEGTGLGLAIVQRAVDDMLGTLSLGPASPHGLHARVVLPLTTAVSAGNKSRVRGKSGVQEVESLIGTRILVVEDDESLRELIETSLALRGAVVTTVSNVRQASAIAGEFALAIVDLTLPDGSGEEVIAALRTRPNAPKCILVSGRESDTDRTREGRPDAAMRKPFVVDDLLDLARAVLQGTAGQLGDARRLA